MVNDKSEFCMSQSQRTMDWNPASSTRLNTSLFRHDNTSRLLDNPGDGGGGGKTGIREGFFSKSPNVEQSRKLTFLPKVGFNMSPRSLSTMSLDTMNAREGGDMIDERQLSSRNQATNVRLKLPTTS